MHEDDREILKQSIRDVISLEGRGKTNRKKFKKQVIRSIRKTSALPILKLTILEADVLKLIEVLWKEVVREQSCHN